MGTESKRAGRRGDLALIVSRKPVGLRVSVAVGGGEPQAGTLGCGRRTTLQGWKIATGLASDKDEGEPVRRCLGWFFWFFLEVQNNVSPETPPAGSGDGGGTAVLRGVGAASGCSTPPLTHSLSINLWFQGSCVSSSGPPLNHSDGDILSFSLLLPSSPFINTWASEDVKKKCIGCRKRESMENSFPSVSNSKESEGTLEKLKFSIQVSRAGS